MLRAIAIAAVLFALVVVLTGDSAVAPSVEVRPTTMHVEGARTGWATFVTLDIGAAELRERLER